jgi:hypothetical protein
MAFLTLEGVYRDGMIEFAEPPVHAPTEGRVLVTFLPANGAQQATTTASGDAETRETLRQRALAQMKEGIPLGGPPYPQREELHDRFTP